MFHDNTLNFFKRLPKHLNLERQQEISISVKSYQTIYRYVEEEEEEVKFVDAKFSNSSDSKYQTPSPYPSTTDVVKIMKTLVQEKNNHTEICMTVKLFKPT